MNDYYEGYEEKPISNKKKETALSPEKQINENEETQPKKNMQLPEKDVEDKSK